MRSKSEEWENTTFSSPSNVHIHSAVMNKIVYEFTLTHRPWTAYSADKVEIMARWYQAVPKTALYAGFDPQTETVIFAVPFDEPYKKQNWWQRWRERRMLKKLHGEMQRLLKK